MAQYVPLYCGLDYSQKVPSRQEDNIAHVTIDHEDLVQRRGNIFHC